MALLAAALPAVAGELSAPLIVLKEFPARYRDTLACFLRAGFTCIPSMPTTSVSIAYPSFDDYMSRALSSKTRKDLRKKFRAAAKSSVHATRITCAWYCLAIAIVSSVEPVSATTYRTAQL